MIRVSAPGKMILIGEYAVLEGAPALVYAVERRAVVQTRQLRGNEFSVQAPSLGIAKQPFVIAPSGGVRFDPRLERSTVKRLDFFRKIFEVIYQYLKERGSVLPALALNLDTNAFYSQVLKSKYGFGSSAALTVALVKTLFAAVGRNADAEEIFRVALRVHHQAQGNLGSGIDIAASNFGGILLYERTLQAHAPLKIPQRVQPWPEMNIVPVWSGHSASTREMVRGVRKLQEENPTLYEQIMHRLMEISIEGCRAFRRKDSAGFLQAAADFYTALDKLGRQSAMPIISDEHRKIKELVHSAGAVYKPSGAGSGDIGLAFSNNPAAVKRLRQKLREHGIRLLDIELAQSGVSIQK